MYEYFSKHSLNYGLVKVNAHNPPYAEIDILDENNKLLYRTRIDSLSQERQGNTLENLLETTMVTVDKGGTVTLHEWVVSSLAQTDALTKLLIEKGFI